MIRYAEAAAAVSAKTRPPQVRMCPCAAAGCPLPGTLGSRNGGGGRYCRLHYDAAFSAFGQISARIHNRLPLFVLAARLENAPAGWTVPPEVADLIRGAGGGEMLDKPDCERPRTARALGRDMSKQLEQECRVGARRARPDIQAGAVATNWTGALDCVPKELYER